ncbi:MAG: hypothetical protein QG639_749 [Patescibacteria group bacterium]|nr:hypothetical protein [Patescibacteria group bacterium]
MLNKSPEAQQFEKELTSKIDAFSFSKTTEQANPGKRWMIARSQRSIEGYRQTTLSSPDVLINLLHSIKLLPPELIQQAIDQMMQQIIDRLKVTAQVTFDKKTRQLLVAGYEVGTIAPEHANILDYLMAQPRGQMVPVEELMSVIFEKKNVTEEASISERYNQVVQIVAGLASDLNKINVTAGMKPLSPVYPLRLIGGELEQQNDDGTAYTTLGYTVWSDFLLDPPIESVAKDEVVVNVQTGLFSFKNETIGGLDEDERRIIAILLSAPENQPVPVKEIAARLGEEWEITWRRLGMLEEMLQSTSKTLFKGEQSLLSLNISAHPIKTQSGLDPLEPTVFLTSSFAIVR